MKIMHILPELDEGGVERHVLMLSSEQIDEGHQVYVVSAGGKLVPQLAGSVVHFDFPVHSKNPLVALYCALSLAPLIRKSGIDIIHAHSRVPAWIAMLVSRLLKKPYVVTAHAYFSTRAKWIYTPYRQAEKIICVSRSVQTGMKECFGDNTVVIRNGMPAVEISWKGSGTRTVRFLFVGRLTRLKGLQDILEVLPSLEGDWQLDILGDGPLRHELEEMAAAAGLEDRVEFHGFRNDPDLWMEKSDCLLFPSYVEGMPLTLARAVQIGIPVIGSDIGPVSEMTASANGLVKPGDQEAWQKALETFIKTRQTPTVFDTAAIPTIRQMTLDVQSLYESVITRGNE